MLLLPAIRLAGTAVGVTLLLLAGSSTVTSQPALSSVVTSGLLRDGNHLLLSGLDIGDRFETHLTGDALLHSRLDAIAQRAFDPACDAVLTHDTTSSCLRRHWGVNTYATVQLYLRMARSSRMTPSSPIRTPSFIPKWTLQYVGLKRPTSSQGSTASMYILHFVPLGHHSNGQNGCEYTSYTRRGLERECESDANLAPEDLQINTYDGNFSIDTFHSGGLYHRWIKFESAPGYAAPVTHETTIGIEIEYNRIDGLLPEVLAARYGKLKWATFVQHILYSRGDFSTIDLRYRFKYAVGIDRPAVHVAEATFAFGMPQLGYYLRYYNGRDYLNIAFDNSIERIEFGFTFDWESS